MRSIARRWTVRCRRCAKPLLTSNSARRRFRSILASPASFFALTKPALPTTGRSKYGRRFDSPTPYRPNSRSRAPCSWRSVPDRPLAHYCDDIAVQMSRRQDRWRCRALQVILARPFWRSPRWASFGATERRRSCLPDMGVDCLCPRIRLPTLATGSLVVRTMSTPTHCLVPIQHSAWPLPTRHRPRRLS